jgi:hypothetical protein
MKGRQGPSTLKTVKQDNGKALNQNSCLAENLLRAKNEAFVRIMAVTAIDDSRLFLNSSGSQTDIVTLSAADIDWITRRLYYERVKLERRDLGRACIVIG